MAVDRPKKRDRNAGKEKGSCALGMFLKKQKKDLLAGCCRKGGHKIYLLRRRKRERSIFGGRKESTGKHIESLFRNIRARHDPWEGSAGEAGRSVKKRRTQSSKKEMRKKST